MQIKEFFLDLREWPQYAKNNKNVWLLESEAFKDPLKFTFTFEDKDKKELQRIKEECEDYYNKIIKKEKDLNESILKLAEREKLIAKAEKKIDDLIEKEKELEEKIAKRNNEYKDVFHGYTEALFKQDQKISWLKEQVSKQKPSKIYHYETETLVTWDEVHYWLSFNLPSWKYAIIEKKEFIPQNEYVWLEKIDPLVFKIEYVKWEYIPEVQIWSSNGIDTPVCKVKFDILFFQI